MTLHSRDSKFWGKQGAGALIIARDTGRVFLVLRSSKVKEPGTWGVLGGAIDESESPDQAARRETFEEVGYTGDIELHRSYVFRSDEFVYHNFIGVVDSEFKPTLNWESVDAGWFDIDDLPSPLHFGLEQLLAHDRDKITSIIDRLDRRFTESHLRQLIRETLVSAGSAYTSSKEAPKQKFEAELIRMAHERAADVMRMMPGSLEHLEMIETALDAAGITEKSLRDLVSRPFTMIPPSFLLKM